MSDSTTVLPPLAPDSPGVEVTDGVAITCVGEDGEDFFALGQDGVHLPRERVLEAMKASPVSANVFDAAGPGADNLEELWAVTLPCDGGASHGEGECNWHIQWSNDLNGIGPDTPGAFPITVLEA